MAATGGSERGRLSPAWPAAAAAAAFLLRRSPLGRRLLFPVLLLHGWIHELGHGLTAVLLGGKIDKILLYPDGSGQAFSSGGLLGGKWGWALVSAGGPLASAAAGLLLLICARRFASARAALWALSGMLLFSAAFWVRTPFGIAAAVGMGAALLALALRAELRTQAVAVTFLGVFTCFESLREFAYIFSARARVGGAPMASDLAQMSQLTGAPRLLLAVLTAAAAVWLLWLALYRTFSDS